MGPPKQRAVLALLAGHAGSVVTPGQIVDALWGSDAPLTAINGVHTYVAGLRRVLEPDRSRRDPARVLVSSAGGYLLRLPPETVDAVAFERGCEQARRLTAERDRVGACAQYATSLGLWRGEALAGIPGPYAMLERTRLNEIRFAAVEEWIALLVGAGRSEEAVVAASDAVAQEPLREKLWYLLMLGLHRCGRQAHALRAYRDARRLFSEELGIEPGPELRVLHARILAGGPADDVPARRAAKGPETASPPAPGSGGRELRTLIPKQLPSRAGVFVGRGDELRYVRRLLTQGSPRRGRATPILAIDGAAGVGKSAFALELAHESLDQFPDGQLYADLSGTCSRRRPLSACEGLGLLLRGLGVEEPDLPADLEGRSALYRSLLHGRRMLVLLDDAVDANQLRPMIPQGPTCVIITSRWRQEGLVVREGAHRIEVGPLDLDTSVDLFTTLLGRERCAGQRAAVERLAELCGRLPLAMRIAAGSLSGDPYLRIDRLVGQYEDPSGRLDHLTVEDDEEVSVRGALSASYRTLTREAARLFRLLGECRDEVVNVSHVVRMLDTEPSTADRCLRLLVDRRLLERIGPGLFRMNELVRIFASEVAAAEDFASHPCST
ncbi:AfsR/SARP family transcriptional regulator [Streptomyces sp. NBC_01803]|uniref:AfsR/SARP family transcriptional regulator n=1 Tax=Streptomyces sp. NBC_01803 TaxID=2975946 RepID=UPI002DD87501|nr:BTAD domain-containing putative transcriptional regulator [Streptomyces sp. NBC_01803]WSA43171.1 winged helix-turn-helix domain-containing protein [Streptomyces sp. NBC_01803]